MRRRTVVPDRSPRQAVAVRDAAPCGGLRAACAVASLRRPSGAPPDGLPGDMPGVETGQPAHGDVRLLACRAGRRGRAAPPRGRLDAVEEPAVDAGHGGDAGAAAPVEHAAAAGSPRRTGRGRAALRSAPGPRSRSRAAGTAWLRSRRSSRTWRGPRRADRCVRCSASSRTSLRMLVSWRASPSVSAYSEARSRVRARPAGCRTRRARAGRWRRRRSGSRPSARPRSRRSSPRTSISTPSISSSRPPSGSGKRRAASAEGDGDRVGVVLVDRARADPAEQFPGRPRAGPP